MTTLNIHILNPKAKKLLQDLADLKLISISKGRKTSFFEIVNRLRSKNADLTLAEINKEVETVRKKRYAR